MHGQGGQPTLTDCEGVFNSTLGSGGGLRNGPGCSAILSNTLVCGNVVNEVATEANQIEGEAWGNGGGNCILASCAGADDCTPVSPCDADVTGDGVVDGRDLAAILAAWGQDVPELDLVGNGTVDGQDLAQVLAAWGYRCGE